MSFLQNLKVYFDQESLPITYHNFRHQSLVRPKILKLKRVSTNKLQSQFFIERNHHRTRQNTTEHECNTEKHKTTLDNTSTTQDNTRQHECNTRQHEFNTSTKQHKIYCNLFISSLDTRGPVY